MTHAQFAIAFCDVGNAPPDGRPQKAVPTKAGEVKNTRVENRHVGHPPRSKCPRECAAVFAVRLLRLWRRLLASW
jgi:hypothetical protein